MTPEIRAWLLVTRPYRKRVLGAFAQDQAAVVQELQVWADWLMERGDQLGELIALWIQEGATYGGRLTTRFIDTGPDAGQVVLRLMPRSTSNKITQVVKVIHESSAPQWEAHPYWTTWAQVLEIQMADGGLLETS